MQDRVCSTLQRGENDTDTAIAVRASRQLRHKIMHSLDRHEGPSAVFLSTLSLRRCGLGWYKWRLIKGIGANYTFGVLARTGSMECYLGIVRGNWIWHVDADSTHHILDDGNTSPAVNINRANDGLQTNGQSSSADGTAVARVENG
ncbi:hypothetical protein CERZMDRAFT_102991 [Cercospora zeae-maydis SCOH1-5]|uniref:Uncharacterized protein n=1 Tax=Cercospora zeae-maydis SCOH1-5 TaxID=717836 RepID=A0A6A6F088_9PEZI|nr:hypothetical protein CERZMDRAFT_102991 [Cercospora zeae-maydis SCOH1-5]